MADKPTNTPFWTDGAGTKIAEPSSGKKTQGFVFLERPPFEWLNWLLYNIYRWISWFKEANDDWVHVGTGATYPDINSAIYAGATKIKLISNITVTQEQDISTNGVVVDTQGYTISASSSIAGAIVKLSGDRITIINELILIGTHTSGSTTSGLEISGDECNVDSRVEQNGAGGTITTGITVSGDDNKIRGRAEAKAGTMTSPWSDSGSVNDYVVRDLVNNIILHTEILGAIPVGGYLFYEDYGGVVTLPSNYQANDGSAVSNALSPINGQTLRDMSGRYVVGYSAETAPASGLSTTRVADIATESSSATARGQASHQINIQHSHDSHTHGSGTLQFLIADFEYDSSGYDHYMYFYNSGGSQVSIAWGGGASGTSGSLNDWTRPTALSSDQSFYTSTGSGSTGTPTTDNELSATQNIQPESIMVRVATRIF